MRKFQFSRYISTRILRDPFRIHFLSFVLSLFSSPDTRILPKTIASTSGSASRMLLYPLLPFSTLLLLSHSQPIFYAATPLQLNSGNSKANLVTTKSCQSYGISGDWVAGLHHSNGKASCRCILVLQLRRSVARHNPNMGLFRTIAKLASAQEAPWRPVLLRKYGGLTVHISVVGVGGFGH